MRHSVTLQQIPRRNCKPRLSTGQHVQTESFLSVVNLTSIAVPVQSIREQREEAKGAQQGWAAQLPIKWHALEMTKRLIINSLARN